MVLVQSKC